MKLHEEFLIGSWITYFNYDIMSHEEQTKRLAELGVNYHPFPFSWYEPDKRDDLEDWKEIDRLNQKYGILYGMVTSENKSGITEEALEKTIAFSKEMSDNLVVFHVFDEPRYNQLSMLGEWVKKYRAANNKVMPVVNLFPSYVSCRALWVGYEGYLQKTIDEIGAENLAFLSHDYYPFDEKSTKMSIFADMEEIRKVAYRNGKMHTHAFLQACKWKGMRMPKLEEIRWQAYAYIAHGFKALSYFNIVAPHPTNWEGYTDCLIMNDGSIPNPELLESVKELNWEIRAVGNQLIHTNTLHAYHTQLLGRDYDCVLESLPKDYYIQPLETSQPFIITEHEDVDKFMIYNRDFEWEGEVKFAVKGVKEIFVFDPKTKDYKKCDYQNGILTVTLKKGEGLLFKKDKE